MPPHDPPRRSLARYRRLFAWWVALCAICTFLAPPLPEADAASQSSKKSKKKKLKKKSKKKSNKKKLAKVANKNAPILPMSRETSGPLAVPLPRAPALNDTDAEESEGEGEGEGEGEEDLESNDEGGGNPESELAAIERELLAQPPGPDSEVRFQEPPVERPSKPVFIKYKLIPGETLEEIAKRHGVTPSEIGEWNGIDPSAPIPRKKKDLRIKPNTVPLPRERLEHLVRRGDTWESVAKEMGLDVATLRRQNPGLKADKLDKLDKKKKHKIVGWRDLDLDPKLALSAKLAQLRVRGGGISIGKPSRGRLVRGVELPERPDLYTRRKPEEAFGSTHTVLQMLAAFTRFRHESSYKGQVVIGGMSRPKGGRFRPHRSHQSGRDVDIRLPLLHEARDKKHTSPADVDWPATWRLIHAFLAGGEVEYIFLDYSLQKRIYEAARKSGVTQEQLAEWLQWPARAHANKGVIRHVKGHRAHMHVRVRCAANEKNCTTSR